MAEYKVATAKADGAYDGICLCGYITKKWPTQEIAAARISEHYQEHKTGQLMTPLGEFRKKHGLVANGRFAVFPEDAVEVGHDDENDESEEEE
jgi:hypothetical protein